MKVHHLKTHPKPFKDLKDGSKTFEVRKDDRDYQIGDKLVLEEYDPLSGCYTGFSIKREVKYKLEGGQYGIEEGYCVMSIEKI